MTLSNIIKNLRYPIAGWIAGVATILVLGWIWPAIFPGIANPDHYDATDPGMLLILGIPILLSTPASLIGGFVGSRLPREGGSTEQMIAAIFLGALFALPFGCYGLWVFSGY